MTADISNVAFSELNSLIVWPYVLSVILMTYAIRKAELKAKRKLPINIRYVALIVGLVFGVMFYFGMKASPGHYIFSFTLATSMYDTIIKWVVVRIESIFSTTAHSKEDIG